MKRVVVTGIGGICALGNDPNTIWKNAVDGKSGAKLIDRFNTDEFKTKFACLVNDFNPSEYLDRNEIRKTDLFTQYALYAASQAMNDADLSSLDDDSAKEFGVIWGSGQGGMITFEEQYSTFVETGKPKFNPFFIPKYLNNMAAGMISLKFGLKGMSYSTVSACASATTAIMEAFNNIRLNKGSLYIVGGSEAPISPSSIGGFNALRALSTENDNYSNASKPFDQNRNGFVMGEGGAALILEEREHAIARGAKIYAEVAGCAMSSDAYHMTSSHPEGDGAALGMRLALEEAQISPKDIDYINCHATSTPVGDIAEINALKQVFSKDLKTSISGTKSMTGHLLGAAGAIESLLSVLSVKNDTIPPTINIENIDPEIEGHFDIVANKPLKKEINYAMNNTFGFGGHNAIAIFKKHP